MYTGVKRLVSGLENHQRDQWLRILRACYETTVKIEGPFAKKWVAEIENASLNRKRLERFGIVECVARSRRGHRAYWEVRRPPGRWFGSARIRISLSVR